MHVLARLGIWVGVGFMTLERTRGMAACALSGAVWWKLGRLEGVKASIYLVDLRGRALGFDGKKNVGCNVWGWVSQVAHWPERKFRPKRI